ncbi:MAG: hypothetical protein LC791_05590 [Acidobacteria bacterium]|nr:hypothetical protein [Acidobacteriota bacterium]
MDRFARVQARVRQQLGTRMDEIEKQHASLKSNETPSPAEALSAVKEVFGLFVDARRYQVEALNEQKFSQSEYDWVRARVYSAAGMQFSSGFDFRKLEEMARSGQSQVGATPNFDLPDVPERNRTLVKPHMAKMDEWLPLAFFGL